MVELIDTWRGETCLRSLEPGASDPQSGLLYFVGCDALYLLKRLETGTLMLSHEVELQC